MIKVRKFVFVFLATILMAGCFIQPVEAALEDDKVSKEQKIEEFKKELDTSKNELGTLEAMYNKIESNIAGFETSIVNLGVEKESLETEITVKNDQIVILKEAFDQKKKEVYSLAKFYYEKGDINLVDVVLESENITELSNQNEYYRTFNELQTQKAKDVKVARENYETEKVALVEKEIQLTDKIEKIEVEKNDLSIEKEKLEFAKVEAEVYVAQVQEQLAAEEASLVAINSSLQAAKVQYAETITQMEESYIAPGNPSQAGFIWPVPYTSNITSGYGYREIFGRTEFHTGIDISASGISGQSVLASQQGVVLVAGFEPGFGNHVVILHPNGIITLYGHLSSVGVSVGQTVSQGARIGSVGSTGLSTGPHLHFQVSSDGTTYGHTNPRNYV